MGPVLFFKLTATIFVLGLFLKGFFPLKKTWSLKDHEKDLSNVDLDLVKGDPAEKNSLDLDRNFQRAKEAAIHKGMNNRSNAFEQTKSHFHDAPHPRVILMIIDAFREDFAYGPLNFMPLSHKILNKGKGFKFTAETMPPTVTLPRIKALVTGSTSSFADVVLNFGSSALEEDNFISRLKADGRRVIFFGDDTWMKLFPEHFERSDGTTSFFVSDYTEVDDNVTRHLQSELDKPTWDMMILHYLGLDHIGHFAGPRSPLIGPKLAEMDRIISQMYSAMEKWKEPSMLIVCGDHGMSDQGGHGGASPGEIAVPVLFLSPQISNSDPKHYGTISQTDLCPTLAVLLGVPIPNGNIGKVVTEILVDYSILQKVNVLHQNAKQAMAILRECVPNLQKESAYILLQETEKRLGKWYKSKNSSNRVKWESQGQSLITSFGESLTLISERVSRFATQYDVYAMAISIILMWLILVSLILSLIRRGDKVGTQPVFFQFSISTVVPIAGSAALSHILMCTGGVPSDTMCSATVSSILVQAVLGVLFICLSLHIISSWPSLCTVKQQLKALIARCNIVEILLLVGTVMHTITLVSSSFVEEEHQTFYYMATALHILILFQFVVKYLHGFHTIFQRKDNVYKIDSLRDGQEEGGSTYSSNENKKFGLERNEDNALCDTDEQIRLEYEEHDKDPTEGAISSIQHSASQASGERAALFMTTKSLLHWTFSVVMVLLILRVLRRWNHTGNKWLDIPDFGDWLVKPEHKSYLSLLTVFAFMIIGVSRGSRLRRVQTMCVNLALCCAYLCRVAQGSLIFPYKSFLSSSGILEARASYFFIALTCFISLLPDNFLKLDNESPQPEKSPPASVIAAIESNKSDSSVCTLRSSTTCKKFKSRNSSLTVMAGDANSESNPVADESFSMHQRLRGIMAAIICFGCLVKQPHNALVIAGMSLTEQMMTPVLLQTFHQPDFSLLYCVWMGHVFFFLQGNSNSISTIDIAASYIGVDSYWPVVNGLLMFLATYVGTIFWSLAFLNHLFLTQEQKVDKGHGLSFYGVPDSSCQVLVLTRVLPLSVYMALVASQRYHLFVWSVFSPKMLYEAASTAVVAFQCLLFFTISKLRY